jgi:hypothetical protein
MVFRSVLPHWRYVALFAVSLFLRFGPAWAESPKETAEPKSGGEATAPAALPGAHGEFTPWMSLSEMNAFFESLEDNTPPGGKNYWDRGHWLNAVEGRWEAGIPQYRLSYGAVPESRAHWWFWYLNQDRESFDRLVHDLADDGCVLVQFNSYIRPGGSERFQGVWHKLVPITHAALLPAGHYRLSEMRGKPLTEWLASLVIEGDRIFGRGPTKEFRGSVRDRFSGTITTAMPAETTPGDAGMESEFLKLLEYGSWQEKNGELRVTKDGKTVLRFQPDGPKDTAAPSK